MDGLFTHPPAAGDFGCFQVWKIMNKASKAIMSRFLCGCTFSTRLSKCPGKHLLDHVVRMCLDLKKKLPRCFPGRLRRLAVNDSSLAPPPRQHSVLLGFPDLDHINRRPVVSPRGFHLQFPDAESFSYCFLITPTGFWEELEELIGRW